jgi:hypothetical protein
MKYNKKVLLSIFLLVIFLSIVTISKATTLTNLETETIAQGEDASLEKVLPEEAQAEFGEITTIENEEINDSYNYEGRATGNISVNKNETTMTQYERGRLNSKVPTVDTSLKIYDYANLFN